MTSLTLVRRIRARPQIVFDAVTTAEGIAEVAGHGTFALTLNSGVCLHSSAAYRDSILRVIPLPALSKRYRGTVS